MPQQLATLAGGCFWGMEDLIPALPGVLDTTVGYTGGTLANPTYEDVKTDTTGHAEAIQILFDDTLLSYRQLLEFFFQIHDPTTLNRQGNDIGDSYRSTIFTHGVDQQQIALQVIADLEKARIWPGKIVTSVTPATAFYTAEAYHQDYLQRYPDGYTCHFIRPAWRINSVHKECAL